MSAFGTKVKAEARLARLSLELESRVPTLATWLEASAPDTLAVYALGDPDARRRLGTTNSIEHDRAEVRRRTRVIRVIPNEASYLRLASALAAERNEQWLARRYTQPTADTAPPRSPRWSRSLLHRPDANYTQFCT